MQECSCGVENKELSSFPCFRVRHSSADHVSYVCQRWCSWEVAVGSFPFDLTRDQSNPYSLTFTVTLGRRLSIDMRWACGLFLTSVSRPSPLRRLPTCLTRHLLRSGFAHVVPQECRSCHFVFENSVANVDVCVALVEFVTHFQPTDHQRSLATGCRWHCHVVSSSCSSKTL